MKIKRYLLALALLLNHGLIADRAKAQDAPKQFTLTLDGQDLQILSTGLSELPYKTVAPLMQKLQGQVVHQSQPQVSDQMPNKSVGSVPEPQK